MTNPTICVRTSGERYALLFLDERPTEFLNHESPVAVTALVWDAAGKDWSKHPILAPGVDAIRPRCWGNDLRHIAA